MTGAVRAVAMAGDGGLLGTKLAAMPEAMKRALGISVLDCSRPPAYLALNFVYATLTTSLFGGILGATIVAKEEAQRTAELLLTLPVSRERVLAGKAIALALFAILYSCPGSHAAYSSSTVN